MASAKKVRGSLNEMEAQVLTPGTCNTNESKQQAAKGTTSAERKITSAEKDNRKEQMAELMKSQQVAQELNTIMEEMSSANFKSPLFTDNAISKPTMPASKPGPTTNVDTNDPFTDNQDLKKVVTVYTDLMRKRMQEISMLRMANKDFHANIRELEATIDEKNTLIDKYKQNQAILEKVVFECRASERGSIAHVADAEEKTARQIEQVKEDAALIVEEVKKAAIEAIEEVQNEALDSAEELREMRLALVRLAEKVEGDDYEQRVGVPGDIAALKAEIAGLKESFKKFEVGMKEEVGQRRNFSHSFANSSPRGGHPY